MLPYRDSRLTKITFGIFFVVVIAYAYFEVRGLLYGPHLVITSSTQTTHESYTVITGHADHIASLSMLGAPVALTTEGSFAVPYLLAPGNNHITFEARDSYGNVRSENIEIVYITPIATSTPVDMHTASTTPLSQPISTSTTIAPTH